MKYIFVGLFLIISSTTNAALIESENYSSNGNSSYWTNLDLGIDVLRLNWVDTLGGENQADIDDFQSFIDASSDTWRFASWSEFMDLANWFDTDPNNNGWSEAQNLGGNLFFELNGYGPDHTEQYGFDHEGYTYWQFGSFNDLGNLEYLWFADFGDQDERVVCVAWSVLCANSYFPDAATPMFTANDVINNAAYNIAPILVRDLTITNVSPSFATVSEPSILWLLLSGGIVLVMFKASTTKRH